MLLPLYVVLRGLDGFFAGLDVFVPPAFLSLNLALNCDHDMPFSPERKYLGQSLPDALLCCITLSALILYLSIKYLVSLTALSTAFLKSPSSFTQISIPNDCSLYFRLPACQHCLLSSNDCTISLSSTW